MVLQKTVTPKNDCNNLWDIHIRHYLNGILNKLNRNSHFKKTLRLKSLFTHTCYYKEKGKLLWCTTPCKRHLFTAVNGKTEST